MKSTHPVWAHMLVQKHGEILTSYWMKPIPDRSCDWEAVFEDYDGATDSHCPMGFGHTEQEAIEDLLERASA